MRVEAQGKSFLFDGATFRFRAIKYGLSEVAGGRFRLPLDRAAGAGYTVVCLPLSADPEVEPATASGLRFMLEFEDAGRNILAAPSRRARRRLTRELATRLRQAVRRWEGDHALLGIALDAGRERTTPPESAAAWRRAADELAAGLHDQEPGLLTAWQSHCPPRGECPPEFDLLIAGLEQPDPDTLASALMASHQAVGDRPLVVSMESSTDREHGAGQDPGRVLDTALRCGAAGTIRPATSHQPQDAQVAAVNRRTVRDLDVEWPSITVVINAYNAQDTLEECLSHCERLEYPNLELIVVDDGSTDATPAIARAHPGVRLLTIPHRGLSGARNVGYEAARGELIAYLDADAYPSLEWPWYLALGAAQARAAGCGGPNIPPPHEPISARVVARSPGGPVPQLHAPGRAGHLPGCNMAFWKWLLERLDGFDPVLEAGEDVELQWRVAEAGHPLAYHPAALVWHHRRPGLRRYLRQQSHYGRGQAILERRYPERFPAGYRIRSAIERLRGRRDGAATPACTVRYLSLPRPEPAALELAHQWGVPAALLAGLTAPLAFVRRPLGAPAGAAAVFAGTLFAIDLVLAGRGRRRADRRLDVRAAVAAFRLLRPLAFRWGHLSGSYELRGVPLRNLPRRSTARRPRARSTRQGSS